MSEVRPVRPVKLFCGILASDDKRLETAVETLEQGLGEIDRRSPVIQFGNTDYYEDEMGKGLLRAFVSFKRYIQPEEIAGIKIKTNEMEKAFMENGRRSVNLDPGYVSAAKLVLATVKNYAHRICLGQGIFAEVTLNFGKDGVRFMDWTYPDYKTEAYLDFFLPLREEILSKFHVNQ